MPSENDEKSLQSDALLFGLVAVGGHAEQPKREVDPFTSTQETAKTHGNEAGGMSRHDPVQSSAEAKLALWGELTAAFAQKGQLLPTSPSEVFEVELSGVAEVQLPEQLRELSFKVEPNSESLGAPATIRHKSVGALKPAPAGQQALEGYKQGELEVCVRPHTGSEMCAPIDSGPAAQIHPTKWATLSTALATRAFASGINVRLHWRDVSEPLATAGTWRQNVKISARSLCRGLLATIVNPRNDAVFGTVSLVFDDAH